jgi:hypothetical protein
MASRKEGDLAMLHNHRRWCVTPAESPDALARQLTEQSWTCCTGFRLENYLWLNDSTSPDAAQEFAVVRLSDQDRSAVQIESITFSWCTRAKALEHICRTLRGEYDRNWFRHPVEVRLETPQQHGCCWHCV